MEMFRSTFLLYSIDFFSSIYARVFVFPECNMETEREFERFRGNYKNEFYLFGAVKCIIPDRIKVK